jgi:energy-coupling factor transport system ATP-binding protein
VRAGYDHNIVLDDIDLSVAAGDLVAVIGRNGAGKTTLLRCLAGVHEPASGEVVIDAHAPRPGRDVSLCPQSPDALLFADTVEQEIAASRPGDGLGPDEMLVALGIDDLRDHHPRDLSAGERLLVATAAVAVAGAPVLLLDEPTRGLDPHSKERLARFLRDWSGRGHAVMFATHDVELIAELATRVVMLAGGEIVADGSPEQVLSDSAVFSPQMTRVFGRGWLTPRQVARATLA